MPSAKPTRPNILIVCTDQQRTDTLSCYGSGFINTPGFDRIAKEGIRFDRAYCPSAVCTPSRVSLLSGQYVSRHNVWSIGVNTGGDVRMIQHHLGNAGYRTGLIGKAHLEAYGAPLDQSAESIEGFEAGYGDWLGPYYGFDHVRLALGHVNYGMTGHYGAWLRERFSPTEIEDFKTLRPVSNHPPFGGEAYRSKLPERFHNSVWTVDSAIEFLDQKAVGTEDPDSDEPFFLFVSFQDPHHPHAIPEDTAAAVTDADVPDPNYVEGELDDKPPHFQLARRGELGTSRFLGDRYPLSGQGEGYDFRTVDRQAARQGRSHYYSMVSIIDQQLLRLWRALEQRDLYDNTLICVTSDHGELLGDHGLWMKGPFHYEQVVRVPLLVKPPYHPDAKAGPNQKPDRRADVVSLVDIVPTCLSSAGEDALEAAQSESIDGTDLLGAPESNGSQPDRAVLVETVQHWQSMVCKSVVSGRHKLTWYAGEEFGELYDLEADPWERKNLWSENDWQARKMALLSKLLDLQVDAGRSPKERISYA